MLLSVHVSLMFCCSWPSITAEKLEPVKTTLLPFVGDWGGASIRLDIPLELDLRTFQFAHPRVNDAALAPDSYHPCRWPMNPGLARLTASGCSNAQPEHLKPPRRPEVAARVCLVPLRGKIESAACERAPRTSGVTGRALIRPPQVGVHTSSTSSHACRRPPQHTAWTACAPSLHERRQIALRAGEQQGSLGLLGAVPSLNFVIVRSSGDRLI
jgi:hypothetical protein